MRKARAPIPSRSQVLGRLSGPRTCVGVVTPSADLLRECRAELVVEEERVVQHLYVELIKNEPRLP